MKIYTPNELWIKIGLDFFLADLFHSLLSTEVENKVHKQFNL